jgi:hypothetical protein
MRLHPKPRAESHGGRKREKAAGDGDGRNSGDDLNIRLGPISYTMDSSQPCRRTGRTGPTVKREVNPAEPSPRQPKPQVAGSSIGRTVRPGTRGKFSAVVVWIVIREALSHNCLVGFIS